jgi:hypothetical protein
LWTRRARFSVAGSVAECVRAHPDADPDTLPVVDRLANGSGVHRVAPVHPDAGCDRHAVTRAHGSSDATSDRKADFTSHRPSDASSDREAHADADAAAEQTRPAWLADE